MIDRSLLHPLLISLSRFPVVGLLGARQVGKTTLARLIAERTAEPVYLDLERPSDLGKLQEPELYLESHTGHLVILDEIQRKPDLFPLLRSLVDSSGHNGQFLVLGSASPELIRQASETLAGRIIYHELTPIRVEELGGTLIPPGQHWLRGGFPRSLLAEDDQASMEWRDAFIQTYLERDIPAYGSRLSPEVLRQLWRMVAHGHGQIWNATRLAASLGITSPTVKRYLDLLESTFLVRSLSPFHSNLGKRLVKAPKVYLRDSGLLHGLLGIGTWDDLHGHPILGASWEGWVIEQVLSELSSGWGGCFYRTSAGAELDLLLEGHSGRSRLAVEIKYSTNPVLSRGFWSALKDLGLDKGYVVCPTKEAYPLAKGVTAMPVHDLLRMLAPDGGNPRI